MLSMVVSMIRFLVFVILLSSCTITHRHGELPKLKLDTDIADDVEIKLKEDGLIVKFEWEI